MVGFPENLLQRYEICRFAYPLAGHLKDRTSWTPLHEAAQNGYTEVVRLLLTQDDIETNIGDQSFETPLSSAARNGQIEVVKLLLAQDDIEINSKHLFSWTPLDWAFSQGCAEVVKLLLTRDGFEIDLKTWDGSFQGLLSWAAKKGHTKVVKDY